jgi:hypothetical protein
MTDKSSTPKKHHFVPQFMLKNFADQRQQLVVNSVSRPGCYVSSVRDLGHRNFGHSLFMPGRQPDHVTLEERMANLEGEAATTIDRLCQATYSDVDLGEREILSFFIALQWSRHRFLLDLVRKTVLSDTPVSADDPAYDFATKSLGLFQILAGVLEPWALRDDLTADYKERWSSIPSTLSTWFWRLFRPREDTLIISDNVVCLSGLSPGEEPLVPPAWTLHGVGIGFRNCRRVTVPLSPKLGLVVARTAKDTTNIRSSDFNKWTTYNSREFVAYNPEWPTSQPKLYNEFMGNLETQRFIIPLLLEGAVVGRRQPWMM